ncbi:hypothetical protein LCGC14_0920830 [marine sediment metagenome]|uniref:Uncharacterized protein n=1 Tax=marine sediment metagenome TaxID=412755 RepID=A0A0F9PBK9_9ZZZZ
MAGNLVFSNTGIIDLKTGTFTPWKERAPDARSARERFIDSVIPLGPAPRNLTRSSRYIAFLRSAEYAKRFPKGQENTYTINIPGIQDVVRIPSLEDKNLRFQRWLRFQNSKPTLPEPLQWIPPLINKLDDAQDLLFTGLALAIPLLRILPKFFLGLLTPLVFLNDALNLATCLLVLGIGGNLRKAAVRTEFQRNVHWQTYAVQRPAQFFKKFPWLGFLIQAPQALQYLTGYGVTLGTVMGFLTDLMWAPVRLAQGSRVTFVGPPPDDITGKAARYLSQPATHNLHNQMYSFDDHLLLTAADSVALQVMTAAVSKNLLASREDVIAAQPVTIYDPWNPTSLEVAEDFGWNPSDPPGYPIPTSTGEPSMLEAIATINNGLIPWVATMKTSAPQTLLGQFWMEMVGDAGETFMEWIHDSPTDYRVEFAPEVDLILALIENGIFPRAQLPPQDWIILNKRAREIAASKGQDNLTPDTLNQALNDVLGGSITF